MEKISDLKRYDFSVALKYVFLEIERKVIIPVYYFMVVSKTF